jgi:cytochrome c
MTTSHSLLLGACMLFAGISAQASEALADKNACLNCHSVAKKMVGPAFKDIAAKYKDRKDASAYLSEKIVKGGTGVWGTIPMPPMAQLKADEVQAMTKWILELR